MKTIFNTGHFPRLKRNKCRKYIDTSESEKEYYNSKNGHELDYSLKNTT